MSGRPVADQLACLNILRLPDIGTFVVWATLGKGDQHKYRQQLNHILFPHKLLRFVKYWRRRYSDS
jgi:hypothetical protein